MSVAKTIEISAESPDSFEEAIRTGITKASQSLHGISRAFVKEQMAIVDNNQVTSYRVHLQVTFKLD